MILRYNMPSLLKIFKGDSKAILYHFERRLLKKPLNRRDYLALTEHLPSFLLEEEAYICYNNKLNEKFRKSATVMERTVYLHLAGKRDYIDYTTKGIKSIPVQFSDLAIDKLKLNSMLDIRNDTIYFKTVPTEVRE